MEQDILHSLGFTLAEAKVYLVLLKLGPAKVGQIIEKSGLQSSTIHNTLHHLIDRGAVTYVLKGKIKAYIAVDPELILKELCEREQRFKEIIPSLKSMQKSADEKQLAEVYEGAKGMMALLEELIKDAKKHDVYYFFAMDVSGMNKEIQSFFEKYDAKRAASGLVTKGLAKMELKPLFKKRKYLRMKYADFSIPSNISLCNDKLAIISWGEKPRGVLLRSKQIVGSQIEFFNEIWNSL